MALIHCECNGYADSGNCPCKINCKSKKEIEPKTLSGKKGLFGLGVPLISMVQYP